MSNQENVPNEEFLRITHQIVTFINEEIKILYEQRDLIKISIINEFYKIMENPTIEEQRRLNISPSGFPINEMRNIAEIENCWSLEQQRDILNDSFANIDPLNNGNIDDFFNIEDSLLNNVHFF